ncbi:MAG: DNRLRE domain-containing protein [Planctomycetota bacterium]|nr:DNRLRE domain-containing protein [Planctomycetota bacterium]
MFKRGWCSVLVVAGCAGVGQGDVINLAAAKDNTLIEDAAGSLSNAKGSYFYSGRTASGLLRRGLLAFDFSAIPAGSTINSVQLTLHVSRAASGSEVYGLHVMTGNWGEGTSNSDGSLGGGSGAAASTGDATWTSAFKGGAAWATLGGDFNLVPSVTRSVVGTGSYAFTGTAMAADVQQWLSNPASNFGWALLGNEADASTAKRFDSRENATPSFRPSLVVTYTPVPSPASAVVLLCGVSLTRRRRLGR